MKKFTFLCLSLVIAAPAIALDLGAVAWEQARKDLASPFRMMCVAAHPDDEDGATLAYYRMLHGVKTHAVIATRGEGGQNEIGPELYNELGVIRTREMMAAAEIEGAQLHFLDLPDFGYSKTPAETFEIWGREVALERTVRVIRETRPHIIITNHGRLQDHGHHQAIGAVVEEAYAAAADPERFPEHRQAGLEPWQVARLYIRDFQGNTGSVATNISALEPARGRTIAEIAASALEAHESQGMFYFINLLRNERHETHYQIVQSRHGAGNPARAAAPFGPLFAGIDPGSGRDALATIAALEDRAEAKRALFGWLQEHEHWKEGDADEREAWHDAARAAAVASELRLRARPDDDVVTRGQTVAIQVDLEDFGEPDAILAEVSIHERHGLGLSGAHRMELPLHGVQRGEGSLSLAIPDGATLTIPHGPRLFAPRFLEPQLEVRARVNCRDGVLELVAPVYLDVAPPIEIRFPGAPLLARAGHTEPVTADMHVTNHIPEAYTEYVSITPPPGWRASPERISVSFAREGEQRIVPFTLTPDAAPDAGDYVAHAGITGGADRAELLVRAADVRVAPGRRAGVIQSYDTTFVETLEKLGVAHETLALDDFRPARLDTFNTIIVDIRAYQYHPDLAANNGALIEFVRRGGTLLVMYQKEFDWLPDYAPYPITLSRNRVTREDAPVRVLAPGHPLFTTPNAIVDADWDGWIQERGLYFPATWHDNYTPLIDVQDPGESIPPGSCLIAEAGKGIYLYTALGWYRQLRELHPGALRVFANMLAL